MRQGDIILTKSKSLISTLISWGEEIEEKDTFEPSHVAIYDMDGWIWESTIGGVQRSRLKKYLGRKHTTFVASYDRFTVEKRRKIIAEAAHYKGKGYGYIDLLIYLADILLEKVGFKRNTLTSKLNRPDRLVCSEFVALCYLKGAQFRFHDQRGQLLKPSSVRPDDIWRTAIVDTNWRIKMISPLRA